MMLSLPSISARGAVSVGREALGDPVRLKEIT